MNSEELELSLRTEFETYLKGLTDDLRREVAEFQAKIESEVEKHKSQLDTAFREFSDRLGSEKEFDGAFSESVVEHLRLARDEGAQLAANAFAEAEDLRRSSAAGSDDGSFAQLRNAIADISAQSSQATILRSLVEHAAKFTTRGAFFIVKNDNFVGWKVFGSNAFAGDETVRSVEFPVGSRSLLADAVSSLQSTSGGSVESAENTMFLDPLGFGDPVSMHAIPLIARGRGVAVLYADTTGDDAPINTEALETLVRVAGLTVELLASAQAVPASAVQETSEAESSYEPQPETAVEEPAAEYEEPTEYEEPSYAAQEEEESASESVYEVEAEPHYGDAQVVEEDHAASFESEEEITYEAEVEEPEFVEEVSQTESGFEFAPSEPAEIHAEAEEAEETAEEVEPEPAEVQNEIPYVGETTSDYSFTTSETSGSSAFEEPAEEPKPAFESAAVSEPVVETVGSQPRRPRLSRRNVDLPIEVTEEERPMHNDARLFARLLVSEIKLYNQQKVNEGRETGDLYDRLREAIDRSREMYEKRVHAPVAQKFDYFHYELVNSLSEGKPELLGSSYPGATV